MIRNIIIACTLIAFCSCNNEAKTTEETATTGTETTTPAVESTPVAPLAGVAIDPVCDMPKEAGWVDYTVSGTDTTWFCSETCKKAHDGNPAKYAGKG